jgi:hypothetical protein
MGFAMRRVVYRGSLLDGAQPHPELSELLIRKDLLIEISDDAPAHDVVIGAPHHAALGTPEIAERSNKPRVADEGAGFVAIAALAALRERGIASKLLIAAHATDHDPNKMLESPYCRELFSKSARLLFECHGASAHRENEIEVSAGSNSLSRPMEFGELLGEATEFRYRLAAQKVPGQHEAIAFDSDGRRSECTLALPALKTPSLVEAMKHRMHALHIEATPSFRATWQRPNSLTEKGEALGMALAEAASGYLMTLRN